MENKQSFRNMDILASSLLSGSISSLLVNPLDVLKIREQKDKIQRCLVHPNTQNQQQITYKNYKKFSHQCLCNPMCKPIPLFKRIHQIIKVEGVMTLLNGVKYSIAINMISNSLFFMSYEKIKTFIHQNITQHDILYPLLSSSIARTLTTSIIFPLEYWKIQQQASKGQNKHYGFQLGNRITSAFAITFKRDFIFSASYWVIAENIKKNIYNQQEMNEKINYQKLFIANIIAGSIGGAISGIITLPLDVVKTRRQLASNTVHPGLIQTLRDIHYKEGFDALFLGIRPRMAKTVIHCSLVLTIYELTLQSLNRIQH